MGKKGFFYTLKSIISSLLILSLIVGVVSAEREDEWDFANGLYVRGMYELAIEEYEKFLREYPNDEYEELALFRIAESYFKLGNFKKARQFYERVIAYQDGEKRDEARLRFAETLFREGEYSRSRTILSSLIDEKPEAEISSLVLYFMGRNFLEEGEYNRSKEYFSSLIDRYPTSRMIPLAHYWLGYSYLKSGEGKQALTQFRLVVKESKQDELIQKSLIEIGNILKGQRKYDEAIKSYRTLREKYPKSPYIEESIYGETLTLS
ncbi:MAG TPA: tetratricopeptide repeat protein, partial [Candidatus Omnitrophica bacterium]|nr:tetratricopeptide repeat protein [Candidatus Omnitrophota bacterium]